MWQKLYELLEQAREPRILVVGDFMIDRTLYGDAERISPEAPVPVLKVVREEEALGGAGSMAADAAALGANVHCVGVVGDDSDADRLEGLLEEAGPDPGGLVRVTGRRTTRKTRLVGLAQHRHRQQLIRVDDESSEPVDEAVIDRLLERIEGHPGRCAVLCVEDYHKGVITPRLMQSVIAWAGERGIPVLVDPPSTRDYSQYAGATLITPNRTETEKLTGLHLRSLEAVRASASRIFEACGTERVCVTLDADGAALIGPRGSFEHIPTRKRDVYDVTGAGDEVLAALAVGLAAGGNLSDAVRLANIAGGLEVEKFGCVPITRAEVLGEILMEHHRVLGKVRTVDQLLPELARRRGGGESIAFTNGCFDLIHAGHVATFAFCREQADVLVVGLNSDASIRRQGKGEDRPIVGERDRAAVLSAMADVDYVVVFDEATPLGLIEQIGPEVLVKGVDWQGKEIVGRECVERRGGRVLLAPMVEGLSTTDLIDRIRSAESQIVE